MKTVNFSETIEACDLNVSRCRQLIEILIFVSIEGLCHFLTLAQGRVLEKSNRIF